MSHYDVEPMLARYSIVIVVTLLCTGCGGEAAAAESADSNGVLKIQLEGVRGNKGKVVIGVYDNQKDFDKNNGAVAWVALPAGTNPVTLSDYSGGKVAIAAFHDENDNGAHDSSDGLPVEGWGYSGRNSQWSQPTYEAALVSAGVVPVKMHYIDKRG